MFPSPLPVALERALQTLDQTGRAELPAVQGLTPVQVARWLLREAGRRAGQRWPLLRWPTSALRSSEAAERLRPVVAGAWLLLDGPGEAPPWTERARGLWRVGAGLAEILPAPLLEAVRAEDRHHAVDVDPALDALRRALLAHCEGGGMIWISGASGSGRRSLASWAHTRLGEGAMEAVSRGGKGRASPGRWALFEELGELGPVELSQLEARQEAPLPLTSTPSAGVSRPAHPAFDAIIGESPALAEVLGLALAVAPSSRSALILGEPGVGKEGLARALHAASGRSGPFCAVDLGAVPEDLLESELFGHARGAFTGADRARLGAFRAAEGGTLLLDEVGNLSLRQQARLLRVLQERTVRPVGEDRPVPVTARVVAATNADLAGLVRRGEFREDLYQRLAGFTLRLPPLRERAGDILRLARHLLARERGAPLPSPWASPEVEAALCAWRWPGNVRELEGRMALAAALCPPGAPLELRHLGELERASRSAPTLVTGSESASASLPRRLWSAVSAASLRVPALGDRPEAWRRDRVLHALDGVPISAPALDALVGAPWWGGFPELNAVAVALGGIVRARPHPPWIILEDVHTALPELIGPGPCRPVSVIVDPHLDARGAPTGLTERFWTRAVVVGRVSSLREIEVALAQRPAERDEVLAALRGEAPGFLRLGWLPELPRVASVISRGPEGLRVSAPVASRVEVWGGPLEPGVALRRVPAARELPLGAAAELLLREPNGRVLLRMLVSEGAAALDERAEEASLRLLDGAPAATVWGANTDPPPAPAPLAAPASPSRSRWVLGVEERAALNALLLDFPGGVLKSWALERAAAWADQPGLRRLAVYLREAPNLADYLGRLYELEDNASLRGELRALLEGRSDAPRLVARWPSRVQRLVEHDGGPPLR